MLSFVSLRNNSVIIGLNFFNSFHICYHIITFFFYLMDYSISNLHKHQFLGNNQGMLLYFRVILYLIVLLC